MKYTVLLWVLTVSIQVAAKAPKIYRCGIKDGTVVIQDRRCVVNELQPAKTLKIKPQVSSKLKSDASQTTQLKNQAKRPNQIAAVKGSQNSNRSPYFTFGWDRFIPANWVMHKINTTHYQQLLLSRTQFKIPSNFNQGVKLSVYANTMQKFRLDAFAQALHLYHQIRDNSSLKLLDSQFKSHPNYKVFNIKYQNLTQQLLLTEFYIDEENNDLFVVTVQAHESEWSPNWQLAEKIISQL